MTVKLASFVLVPAAKAVVGMLQQPKGIQQLDPIATLFTLAMRNLKDYDNAKPAVQRNYLYFDKETLRQGSDRTFTRTKIGHEDLGFLHDPLKLLGKGWKLPAENPLSKQIISIVNFACEGLDKIEKMYRTTHPEYTSVPGLVAYNKELLQKWIKGTVTDPMTQDETLFVNKIKAIWTEPTMTSFYNLYTELQVDALEAVINNKRDAYLTEINKG